MRILLPEHIGFTDGLKEFRLSLQDGARGLAESGSQPSSLFVTGGGSRTGDFEPNFSHVEQRTWHGGRAVENLVDDASRFFDSRELISFIQGKVFPAPKWYFAQGLRTSDENLHDNISFLPLVGASQYASTIAVGGFTNMEKAHVWVRQKGAPQSDLTFELWTDSSGSPGSLISGTQVTTDITDIPDVQSVFKTLIFPSLQTLTTYHIVIYGGADDTIDSCWEVGYDADGTTGKISPDGVTWTTGSAPAFDLQYRVTGADARRRWLDFDLDGGKYFVSVNDDGSNSKIFLNGYRSVATSATSTTLTDSTATGWTTDKWKNARVKIVSGTGKGQNRKISGNTTTALTLSIAWDVTPDATSNYIIYATPYMTEITVSTATWGKVVDVSTFGNIVYFALGQSVNMARMRQVGGVHSFADDGTNKADKLYTYYDSIDGPQIVRANNDASTISRASTAAWGTDLTFNTSVPVGGTDTPINNFIDYDSILWVFKPDSAWTVQNDVPRKFNAGLNAIAGPETGYAVAVHDLFLYFSWWKSIEQLYGGTLDDVGPWRDEGLPVGRGGSISGLVSILAWLFVGVNAGPPTTSSHWRQEYTSTTYGLSSVLVYMDRGFHEVFRGYAPGYEVRGLSVQENAGTYPRLWIDYNGELIFQDYSLTMLEEPEFKFMHEASVTSAAIDVGHASTFKFFKELDAVTERLSDEAYIEVDYQYGEDVGTDVWTNVNALRTSPVDTATINLGEVSKIRYRLRLLTENATIPPVVRSVIMKGYEVLPTKRVWTMRIKASSLRAGANAVDPHDLYSWMWEATQRARRVWMYSVFPELNGTLVRIEPPSILWRFINRASNWTGVFTLVVREM